MSGYQGKVLAGKDTLSTATSPWHSVTEALMPQDDRGTGSQSAATTASTGSWGRNTSACNHEQLSKHETCQEGRKVESRLEMQRAPSQGWCWHRGGCVFLGAQSSGIPGEGTCWEPSRMGGVYKKVLQHLCIPTNKLFTPKEACTCSPKTHCA